MSTRHAVIVAVALLTTACGATAAGPPEIVVDRTVCSHCGMFVSELSYAAAYQAHGQEPRVFDEIGCMLEAVRRETATPANVWVQDTGGAGWLDAAQAVFVASPRITTPMGGGVIAYADAMAAWKAATTHRGEVARSLSDVMALKGDAR